MAEKTSYSEHFAKLPASIQKAVQLIVDELDPQEVILFGSRAREDHRENSDFDLAVKASTLDQGSWARVLLAINEDSITLYPVDVVHFERMAKDYQKNISKEGKSLYVR